MTDLSTLSPKEKNVRLAKLVGYESRPDKHYYDRIAWYKDGKRFGATIDLPNFCSDLNAVATVEATLSDEKARQYMYYMQDIMEAQNPDWDSITDSRLYFVLATATATQRTEALILTLQQ